MNHIDRRRLAVYRERNKATATLILLAFIGGLGGVVFAFGWYGWNWLEFSKEYAIKLIGAGAVLAFTSSVPAVFAIENYLDARKENKPPDKPKGQPRDTSNRFMNHRRITETRLESRSGNQVHLGRMNLSKNEWRKLASQLANKNWAWSRRILQSTHIWNGLTMKVGGVTRYDIVVSEFERLQAVRVDRDENGSIKKVTVTVAGREEICRLAGTPLL